MATLRPMERLQPALLDRLQDDEPLEREDLGTQRRVMTAQQLRAAVLRDLNGLFNAANPVSDDDAMRYPHVAASVFSFGLPPIAGRSAASLDLMALADAMRRAIVLHEQRILPEGLSVDVVDPGESLYNQLSFRIVGRLWSQPVPLELLFQTDLDLDTGQVRVGEYSGRSDAPR